MMMLSWCPLNQIYHFNQRKTGALLHSLFITQVAQKDWAPTSMWERSKQRWTQNLPPGIGDAPGQVCEWPV